MAIIALVGAVVAPLSAARAQEAATYVLRDVSSYGVGCWGPCLCPVRGTAMPGTFRLRPTGVDPLYANYAIEDFQAVLLFPEGPLQLKGSGDYRVGGEVALMHQLRLRLVYPDGYEEGFDSGLVPGGSDFPSAIELFAAAHGFACWDTVLGIFAKQESAGNDDSGSGPVARVVPNPFHTSVELRFQLAAEAGVDAEVVDLTGRQVRRLASGERLSAGSHALVWDGRGADGALVAPGIYFGRVRWADGAWTERLVKLE